RGLDAGTDRLRQQELRRDVRRRIRVVVQAREIAARAQHADSGGEHDGAGEGSMVHGLLVHFVYGRMESESPMLRAVGCCPNSMPCTLLASNAVSGSMFSAFDHRPRLRPISATVPPEKPRRLMRLCGSV